MKALPLTIIAGLTACLLIASAHQPASAARMTGVKCLAPRIVAEHPAGPVTIPAAPSRDSFSEWSGRFRMALDSKGQFAVNCTMILPSTGTAVSTTASVDCGSHVNLVRARRGPNGLLQFECIARDHRR